MASTDFISRDELMAGLVAKRARTLLYVIESRTAHLVAQDRLAANPFLDDKIAKDRELAYLAAFSQGKQPPRRPTIQDIERYAPQWEMLAPDTPRLRAALAHSLAEKYALNRAKMPGIRHALHLDAPETAEAYQRLYGHPLSTIYPPRIKPSERLRWAWTALAAQLENLPPFWSAFAMTLTETIGVSILALPLAVARAGPLAGLALLVVFGLVNIVSVACMSESVMRSGTIRFGHTYIGRVVQDYLGRPGSLVLSIGTFMFCLLILVAYLLGFSASLASVTPVPAAAWVIVLCVLSIMVVRNQAIGATMATALLIGIVNISLLLVISLLASGYMQPERLSAANPLLTSGQPFDAAILGIIFGVIACAYFGHLSISTYARKVIRQDPSGRSMIWGGVAAMAAAMVIYLIWTLAITGAVDRQDLLREVDSALIPLARVAGAPVQVLGTIFVILGLGLGAIQTAYSLYELTCERLPRHEAPVIVLPRRRGRIVFEAGGRDPGLRLTLVYLGLDEAGPRLRLDVESNGRTQHHYITPGARWDAAQLAQVALGRHRLILEVTQAIAVHIVLRINSTMTLRYEGEWDTVGLGLVDMLELGEAEQRIMAWMMRSGGVSLAQVAAYLDQPETQAGEVLSLMIDEGLIAIAGNPGSQTYRVMLSPKRGRQGAAQIWAAIGQPQTNQRLPRSKPIQQRIRAGLLGEPGRAVLSMAPLGLSFILAEWGILSGSGSFSELIGLIGVAIIPLLTGLFPVLMLIASRRKGEYVPGVAYRLLGNPLVLGFIYVLSLTSLLLHGLVIWEEPVRRLVVLAVGGGVIVLTVLMIRRGAFTPRTVVRVCDDQRPDRKANYSLVSVGKLLAAPVLLTYAAREERADTQGGQLPDFQALRRVVVDLPARAVGELEIWVHRVTPESESEPLPARAEVRVGTNEARCFDLAAADGKVIVADSGEPCQVQIIMHDQS